MQTQDSSHPSGVSTTDHKAKTTTIRARERKANAALALALAGAEWSQIAESVGYPTPRTARVAVERALEKQLAADPENRTKMRLMASRRLERLLLSVWQKATNPDDPEHLLATTKARELIGQWTKLHGLDAPQEVVIHSPTNDMLEDWVTRVLSVATPQVDEDDFLDVEVTEIVREIG